MSPRRRARHLLSLRLRPRAAVSGVCVSSRRGARLGRAWWREGASHCAASRARLAFYSIQAKRDVEFFRRAADVHRAGALPLACVSDRIRLYGCLFFPLRTTLYVAAPRARPAAVVRVVSRSGSLSSRLSPARRLTCLDFSSRRAPPRTSSPHACRASPRECTVQWLCHSPGLKLSPCQSMPCVHVSPPGSTA